MFAKVEINGTIEVKTGLHIGGSSAFAAIGAVDSPVARDTRTDKPFIPGSSLKGKLRTLLAKLYNEGNIAVKPDDDAKCLTDLFGSAKKEEVHVGRLLFSDMFLSNEEELKKQNIYRTTEVKFENSISRSSGVANPRQLERVVRGAEFGMNLIYEFCDNETMLRDMKILADGFRMLQYDYLGGSGSRGYGKVIIKNIDLDTVIGEVDEVVLEESKKLLAGL